jgi:probable O-glycosylation ligase (exosortase A-associated)
MRDIALVLLLAVLAPLAIRFPYVGLYVWEWLSLMNPHRLGFGFARDLPLNFGVAALTVGAWLISSKKGPINIRKFGVILAIFSIWITITTFAAPSVEASMPLWDRNIKTMLLIFMVIIVINSKTRLYGLLWILFISLGFFGVKGAGFLIATGFNATVFGPPDTMIEDNNSLALALVMIAPVLNFMRIHSPNKIIKLGVTVAIILVLASVIGTYSRGGLIALAAMLGFLWIKSRSKGATLVFAIVTAFSIFAVMPDKYIDRISTIKGAAESDDSFKGRLDAWEVAWYVALDRPLGAGFDGPRQWPIWSQYLPDAAARASHSIYFMVLGEHGFVGFGIYLCLLAAAWFNFGRVIRLCRDKPELLWAADLARAIQVGMVGFCVGGAALPMAYYDGFLTLLAIGPVLLNIVERHLKTADNSAASATTKIHNSHTKTAAA